MSNEDQRNEIEALESIFGEQFEFAHGLHKNAIKIHLQPFVMEDPSINQINHVQCDVVVIFGTSYPQRPLHQIFVDVVGMDEYKLKDFSAVIHDMVQQLVGDDHHTVIHVVPQRGGSTADKALREDFYTLVDTLDTTTTANTTGTSTRSGEIYLFELLENIREWLANNNTREKVSLRDAVQNIDQIDDDQRRKELGDDEDEDEEENEVFEDPYDEQDNVFVQEYPTQIDLGTGLCTAELFERWSTLFLQEQAAHRAKVLAEQGKVEKDMLPTGKQLFLQNMVNDLYDDGGGNAMTFVKAEKKAATPERVGEEENTVGIVELDLDEIDVSLFDMDSEDDDDDDNNDINAAAAPAPTPTPTPTPTPAPAVVSPKVEKKKEDKKEEKKEKKEDKKKDDKKDSKKKDDKKDNKKSTKKDAFGGMSGGFSDFLGDF